MTTPRLIKLFDFPPAARGERNQKEDRESRSPRADFQCLETRRVMECMCCGRQGHEESFLYYREREVGWSQPICPDCPRGGRVMNVVICEASGERVEECNGKCERTDAEIECQHSEDEHFGRTEDSGVIQ